MWNATARAIVCTGEDSQVFDAERVLVTTPVNQMQARLSDFFRGCDPHTVCHGANADHPL
jgi:hypothetical protein